MGHMPAPCMCATVQVRLGDPMMHPNEFLDIMHNQLNKTQIVHAAIFDLLTSQCDRHAQVGGMCLQVLPTVGVS